ncbi:MAG: hypothetical protein Q7T74_02030 [Candidatus Saccharibacteria bacterium]|nr:hypothetical protein [Candidatus Saccharibacteria bacterium]
MLKSTLLHKNGLAEQPELLLPTNINTDNSEDYMNQSNLKQDLLDLIGRVEMDDTITDDLKEKLKDLITVVGADPTPGNLEALSTVLEDLASLSEYKAVTTRASNLEEDEAMLVEDDADEEPVTATQ